SAGSRAAEDPLLQGLQQLVPRERMDELPVAVALRDREIVLERLVRLLQRVPELVPLEHVVVRTRALRRAPVRVHRPADRPDAAVLPFDPDHDRLRLAVRVDSAEHPLREPSAVGGGLHDSDDYNSTPRPAARARSTTAAAAATSQAARPFDLKTTMSSSDWRPGTSPATTSCSSCTSSQSRTPESTGSLRSADSSWAFSRESQQTKAARSRTTLSSSRRRPSFAPTAQTSAPGCSHSPRRTGSFDVVTVTTTSHRAGSPWLSPGSASCFLQKARRFFSLRQ